MRFIITPAVQKVVPGLPNTINITADSLLQSLIKLELQICKNIKTVLPIGLFTITNQLIKSAEFSGDTIIVKLAALGAGGKQSGFIIGGLMIAAGIALAMTGIGGPIGLGIQQFGIGMAIGGALTIVQTALFKIPTLPGLGEVDSWDPMPAYNISAFSNKIGQEYPIPLCYGLTWVAGPILDYIEEGIIQSLVTLTEGFKAMTLVAVSQQEIETDWAYQTPTVAVAEPADNTLSVTRTLYQPRFEK